MRIESAPAALAALVEDILEYVRGRALSAPDARVVLEPSSSRILGEPLPER